ncbi:aggregation-promoting factor C-terminal-like domain-containing protein [Microbacterium mangrovi]|uniref:aggregation-promoting factor C-terminal-like domain-containing protein n=1 Tax=Microbacterium mangrovi TaxID=1348253 RepID=UPI0012DFF371|nr:hypothetical protein [Microbacterium mangrovi]
MRNSRNFRHIGIGLVVVVLATWAVPSAVAVSGPAPSAPGYPTWSDVQKARSSVAATNAEVVVVKAALDRAQQASAAATNTAYQAAQAAQAADAALATATTRADALRTQADAATTRANRAKGAVGDLAPLLYEASGSGKLMEIATSSHPSQLLARLGVLQNVTQNWNDTAQGAVLAMATAASLRNQANRAEAARTKLARAAEAASAAAAAAAQAAQTAVAQAQAHTDTLYAQLAALKNTSAAVERKYEIGVRVAAQAAAERRAREQAAAAAAARRAAAAARHHHSGGGSSSSGGGGGGGGSPSSYGVVVDPAGAQAYARRAIGAYGWGSGQFQCLIDLWNMESGWRANATNPSSGAYGIPQSLPGWKMAAAGPDWRTNGDTQIDWGLAYISQSYGTPCGAWNHEMSVYPHWY